MNRKLRSMNSLAMVIENLFPTLVTCRAVGTLLTSIAKEESYGLQLMVTFAGMIKETKSLITWALSVVQVESLLDYSIKPLTNLLSLEEPVRTTTPSGFPLVTTLVMEIPAQTLR